MRGFITKALGFIFIFFLLAWWGGGQVSAATVEVTILSSGNFSPSTVNITVGDTVTWTDTDGGTQVSSDNHPSHTGYPDPACPDPDCFDSDVLAASETYSFTFNVTGTWDYHDHVTPGKTGTVIVNAVVIPPTNTGSAVSPGTIGSGYSQIPPAAITDLVAANATASSVDLTWSAPGGDGNDGTAARYDIRYAIAPITASNWFSATQFIGEPTPAIARTAESVTITMLSDDTVYYFAIKTSDQIPNESKLSNVVSLRTIDATAPAVIGDLAIANVTTSIDLTWTAPENDETSNAAASYDIRYSTVPISDANWALATQVTDEPTPSAFGSQETMTISELSASTTYYIVIRTLDEIGNESSLSNGVNFVTVLDGMVKSEEHDHEESETQVLVTDRVKELQAIIVVLRLQIQELEQQSFPSPALSPFTQSLHKGLFDHPEVTKLQQFLAKDSDIYPEGYVTGYFGPLTLLAVQRFQLKHAIVASPEDPGYGFVGPKTRAKLNVLVGAP